MTNEYCEVIEVVGLGTSEAEIMDQAVAVYEFATAFSGPVEASGAYAVLETGYGYAEVAATDYAWVSVQATVSDSRQVDLDLSAQSTARGTDSQRVYLDQHIEDLATVTYLALESSSVALSSSATAESYLSTARVISRSHESVATAVDYAVFTETVMLSSTALATTELSDGLVFDLRGVAYASDVLSASSLADVTLASSAKGTDDVSGFDQVALYSAATAADFVQPVGLLVTTSKALGTTYAASQVEVIQVSTARGSAADYVDDSDAYEVHAFAYADNMLSGTIDARAFLVESAIVQDQNTVAVAHGSVVAVKGRLSDVQQIEITVQVEEALSCIDTLALEFDVPALVGEGAFLPSTIAGTASAYELNVVSRGIGLAEIDYELGTGAGAELLVGSRAFASARVEILDALVGFAWVLNSQSLAHSYYDDFVDFNSAVQIGRQVFFLTPDGLYELGGDSNDGEIIEAEVVTGQMDFGTIDRKRIEQFDLGYTATGDLEAVVSCEGFQPSQPQLLEARLMNTARTSRIRIGKGMVGKYWKVELRNREGSDFELFSMQAKVAISTRRMR